MPNPLSYQQVLALSKGLNFFYLEDGRSKPITFNPIDSKILLSDNGILLREKTQDLVVVLWESNVKFGQTSFRLGNPPKINNQYLPGYNIKKCNDDTINNIFKFSYYDYFGDPDFLNRPHSEQGVFFNTEDGELAPEAWMQVEKNYINNNHIVDVLAFTDPITQQKPFNTDGTLNTQWNINSPNCASILALGNPDLATVSDGFFAHIVGGGDNFIFQKANGTLDALGSRNLECDSFIFDPFNGPVFPNGRLNNVGQNYGSLKPVNYDNRIESMHPYGLWEPNSVTPNAPISLFSEYLFEGTPESAELFRFVDCDIYTNAFQRSSVDFSIDDVYPKWPYSKTTGTEEDKFDQFGGIDGTLTILKNTTTAYWEQGLTGSMAVSGQGGIFVDNRSSSQSYLNQLPLNYQDISLGFSRGQIRGSVSLYDLVDTQRRAAASPAGTFGFVKPISVFKAPYYDFITTTVKGVTKQRIAAGFFSSFFIDVNNKIDAPQTVYSNVDSPGLLVNITNLVRDVYSTRNLKHYNKALVNPDTSNTVNLAFANGSFASTINTALAGEDIKKVCGYQNEIAWINKAGIVKYTGFNSNMANAFALDEEALDVALNKNTNQFARRFAVKINPSGVITVADGVPGLSSISDLIDETPLPNSKGSFVSVDAGFDHIITLKSSGAVIAWGTNNFGQTAVPSGVLFKSVKAHGNYSCGITTNDTFIAWGSVSGSVSNAMDYWVGPTYVIVKVKTAFSSIIYEKFGNVPQFVNDFFNNLPANNIVSAAFTEDYLIVSFADLQTNYISAAGSTTAITNLPSTSSFQDVYFIHGAKNYSLVVGEQGLQAPIKEIYTKDLDDDGIDESQTITYESIDLQGDLVFASLDSNGTLRFIYVDGLVANNADIPPSLWLYFGENDASNYLIDSNGNFYAGQNEGFVSVKCTGGYGGTPTVIWCLHENGILYGTELRTATRVNKFGVLEKINPQDSMFGKNVNNRIAQGVDAYPNTFQTQTSGGSRNFIKTLLNKIPKDEQGIQFPVVEIFGGYASLGGCVCVNTKYTGSTSELIPYQEPELVLFINNKFGSSRELDNIISRLQRKTATIDPNGSGTATYTNNPKFSLDFYNKVFGIVVTNKGSQELIYTTPRSVSIARSVFNTATANDFSNLFPSLCIHGNNGNVTFLAHKKNLCNFEAPQNLNTFNNDLNTNGFVSCSCSFTSNLVHGIFNSGGSASTNIDRYFKPEFVPEGSSLFDAVTSDPFTGVTGGSGSAIIIPGLSFDTSPSGFQQFYIDQQLVGKSGGDFNLDSEVGAVEKQLHNTGVKLFKKLK